ncbi:MAG: hypothetical protein FJX67_16450 [Alphaproteobacteria bacterium]|nr:hypothetical protein [Alphaproteobacteria bacterium]
MRRGLAVFALATLTGCADGVVIHDFAISSYDAPGELGWAAKGGEMKLVVVGNPFGVAPAALTAATAAAMEGPITARSSASRRARARRPASTTAS